MIKYTVSSFIEEFNELVAENYIGVEIEGEVASLKVNHDKWVFFDLKDEESSLNCFMPIYQMRMPIVDGMKVIVKATPKVTTWGKFSLVVRNINLVGTGDLKRSFEMLKKKLMEEGLFDEERKRALPKNLTKIGVISSMAAAGFADFKKILNARWGGMEVLVAHTMVQGESAADQMIRALDYLNQRTDVQLIAIMRGGGSADDLACFNDEYLVRAIAGSRVPVITGIGHEVDRSLADFAADIVASTPSNLAEMISKDRIFEKQVLQQKVVQIGRILRGYLDERKREFGRCNEEMKIRLEKELVDLRSKMERNLAVLKGYDPEGVLARGYAIIEGENDVGGVVKITTFDKIIKAEVKNVEKR